jgi:hypothetical protein
MAGMQCMPNNAEELIQINKFLDRRGTQTYATGVILFFSHTYKKKRKKKDLKSKNSVKMQITFVLSLTFSSDSSLMKAFEQVPNALLAQLANARIQ